MTLTADADDFHKIRPQRLRPLTALRAFQRLIHDKDDTVQVFRIMQALSGRSVSRGYQRMLTTMEGGRQAFLHEELAHKLDDPVWLARFQPGTVGADGLAEVEREVVPLIDAPHPIIWYSRRLRDVHDIWHVLAGYGTDALGEACVVSFSYGQTRNLGFAFIGWGAAREVQREARSVPARRAVWQAYRNGKAARWLPGLDYEALFEQPLEDVRRRLNIAPATIYQSVPAEVRAGLKLRA